MSSCPQLCLIDGSGFIFRAFHALPPLNRPDGTPVNAVFGFCQMLTRLRQTLKIDHWAVALDAGRITFRQDLYPGYKSHRPPPPPELIPQFDLIRKACEAYGIPWVALEGFEADDLMATYAEQARQKGWRITLVTSDKDMMQLVDDAVVFMYDPMKRQKIGPEEVVLKFGVPPHQVKDVLALMGDSSDNIPGVPSVGPKTAAELIRTYGSMDALYEHIHTVKPQGRQEKLATYRDQAFLSRALVALRTDAPVSLGLDDLEIHSIPLDRWNDFLKEQGFYSLIKVSDPVSAPVLEVPPSAQAVYQRITQAADLKRLSEENLQEGKCALLWRPEKAKEQGILELFFKGQPIYHIPMNAGQSSWTGETLSAVEVAHALKPLWLHPNIEKITYDLKRLAHLLQLSPVASCHDLMVLQYVAQGREQAEGLEGLAQMLQSASSEGTVSDDGLITQMLSMFDQTRAMMRETPLWDLYHHVEAPLVPVLWAMENKGVYLNPILLREMSQHWKHLMARAAEKIYGAAGETFNLASPKQLGIVLFEHLKIPPPSKTKTGQYKTDSEVLEELAEQGYGIAQDLLEWRQWAKLNSTYAEGLAQHINASSQRVHTTYRMTATSTGRLSSSQPNLQNLPHRTDQKYSIRRAFQAQKVGYTLVWLDYSQIELRLLAHMAHVTNLQNMFREGGDIHALTAASMFQRPVETISQEQRYQAKAINFGIIYGMSPFGLARQLGIPRTEAAAYIERYFQHYPEIQAFMEETKEKARRHGYVETLMGRRCVLEGLHDRNPMRRQMAERQAINAPLQGSQADMIKKAMIAVDEWLIQNHLQGRLVLQVHDELVFECPVEEAEQIASQAQHIMINIFPLNVPIVVSTHIHTSWEYS